MLDRTIFASSDRNNDVYVFDGDLKTQTEWVQINNVWDDQWLDIDDSTEKRQYTIWRQGESTSNIKDNLIESAMSTDKMSLKVYNGQMIQY